MAVDIAYIVSHGFAARMVTQTDLLKLLRDKGKTVALICPDGNDPNLKKYCEVNDIKLVEFDARKGFGNENYMFKRKYFLEDIESNPALLDKHVHAIRYNTSKHPIRKIRPYFYWGIYKLIPYFPSIRDRFLKNEKRNLKSERAKELIEQLRPARLVATYPVNYNEAVLLHYGNLHPDVETWIHLLSWDNITCKGRFPEVADKYIAWGDIMRNELEQYYKVNSDGIYACGVPHFDLHTQAKNNPDYKRYVSELALDPEMPYVFFAMSSPRFAPKEIDIVEWLAEKISTGFLGKEMQLVIRPHPQNVKGNLADSSWLPRLKALSKKAKIGVDFPNLVESNLQWSMQEKDMHRLSHLLTGSKIVLNSGSTISIDALMHDKPVVITAFDAGFDIDYWKSARRLVDYVHLKKLIHTGGVIVAKSFDELIAILTDHIQGKGIDPLLIQKARNTECAASGDSTQMVAEILAQ